jgi:hypothetical protein
MDQDPPIFTMSLHGDDVHYVKAGGGPVVVLIHGILGSRRRGSPHLPVGSAIVRPLQQR